MMAVARSDRVCVLQLNGILQSAGVLQYRRLLQPNGATRAVAP